MLVKEEGEAKESEREEHIVTTTLLLFPLKRPHKFIFYQLKANSKLFEREREKVIRALSKFTLSK